MADLRRQLFARKKYGARRPRKIAGSFGRAQSIIFSTSLNRSEGECRWPVPGGKIQDCDFQLEAIGVEYIPIIGQVALVKIPKGTKLFHATAIFPGESEWFKENLPVNLEKGMVWFASSREHAININYTHLLQYIVNKPLTMVYEQHLPGNMRGYEYVSMLGNIKNELLGRNIEIDGYLGCNECEIGIFNNSVKYLDKKPEVLVDKGWAYID